MDNLRLKIENAADSAIRQIPKARDLKSLSENLEKKGEVVKIFTKEAESIVNEHYKGKEITVVEKEEVYEIMKESMNRIMAA